MAEPKYQEIAGSGSLRVTTRRDVAAIQRTVAEDIPGLLPFMSDSAGAFWTGLGGVAFSPTLQERVWVANRCIQLNSQQIASMPMRFVGTYEPAWVSNPDPSWYPNGIGDATFAAVKSMYGYGDAFLLITDRYASGFPSGWTVLDPVPMDVRVIKGKRRYRSGNIELNPDDVVQISRDAGGVRGTSSLRSYASQLFGLSASSELARALAGESGIPNAVLKSKRRLDAKQAAALQSQWVNNTAVRRGAPAILPPDIDFEQLSFSMADLMLLDVQSFDARVIASAFSVPPFMINMPLEGGLTYQNPETLFEVWWRTELRPMALRFTRALSANMLPRGSFVESDARAVLAPTFKDLVDAWVTMQKEGIVTTDEVRAAILHLPPIADDQGEALAELTTPPTASASPTQQDSASVIALRPTQSGVI